MKRLLLTLSAILALFAAAPATLAQVSSAQITGIVIDSSGAALPQAKAIIVSKDTGARHARPSRTVQVSSMLPLLIQGHYRITIEATGFDTYVNENISLTIGEKKSLTFTLSVGTQQSVAVSADEPMINTTSGEISQVINQRSITELPLNGRDPSSLVFLTTGVTNVLQSPIGLSPGGTAFPTETNASAGGGRQGSTFYLLDGSPNMDTYLPAVAPFPNADATQEFRVLSNNFDARHGYPLSLCTTCNRRNRVSLDQHHELHSRRREPREPMDLFLPAREQMKLIRAHNFPATWLLQYDALVEGPFVDFLKTEMLPSHEVGLWLEMNRRICDDAGVAWRGKADWEWDYHVPIAYSIGYRPEERRKLADTAIATFKRVFGRESARASRRGISTPSASLISPITMPSMPLATVAIS